MNMNQAALITASNRQKTKLDAEDMAYILVLIKHDRESGANRHVT